MLTIPGAELWPVCKSADLHMIHGLMETHTLHIQQCDGRCISYKWTQTLMSFVISFLDYTAAAHHLEHDEKRQFLLSKLPRVVQQKHSCSVIWRSIAEYSLIVSVCLLHHGTLHPKEMTAKTCYPVGLFVCVCVCVCVCVTRWWWQ